MLKLILTVAIIISIMTSCTTQYINSLRDVNQTNEFRLSQNRALSIRYNDTAYSKPLEIYGYALKKHLASVGLTTEQLNGLRFGVDNIYDKTGKIFGTSDAISDIVISAFTKMNVFPMLNLDRYSPYSNLHIRENLLSGQYTSSPYYANNIGMIGQLPVGVLKPTNYYVSGALLQYDIKKEDSINFDIKYASVGRNFSIIDIGLDLRIINSGLGVVVVSGDKNSKSASVSLINRVVTFSVDGEYFKLVHDDAYGVRISNQVNDPTQYAVREIVELAVLEVVSRLSDLDWKKTEAIKYINKNHSNFVIDPKMINPKKKKRCKKVKICKKKKKII